MPRSRLSADDDLLATPLQFLKGVGPRRAADLARSGLTTLEDLLYRFPIRYEDRSRLQPIAAIHPGRPALVFGRVPVYEKAGAVTAKMQRKIVHDAFERLPADLRDPLPATLLNLRGWPARGAALTAAHFPPADLSVDALNRFATPAQQRLIFEEA